MDVSTWRICRKLARRLYKAKRNLDELRNYARKRRVKFGKVLRGLELWAPKLERALHAFKLGNLNILEMLVRGYPLVRRHESGSLRFTRLGRIILSDICGIDESHLKPIEDRSKILSYSQYMVDRDRLRFVLQAVNLLKKLANMEEREAGACEVMEFENVEGYGEGLERIKGLMSRFEDWQKLGGCKPRFVIVDVPNVARIQNKDEPSLSLVKQCLNELPNAYIPILFVSKGLGRFASELEPDNMVIVAEEGAGDFPMLALAELLNAFVLSRDSFKEYRIIFPWIDMKVIRYAYADNKFTFIHPPEAPAQRPDLISGIR